VTKPGIKAQGKTLKFPDIISNIRCVIVYKIVAVNLLNEIYDARFGTFKIFSDKNVIKL